ncbi:VOC family protein [Nocardioides lentus]
MSIRMNPYLSFAGTAAEALTFYHSVLGGTLDLTRFAEFMPDAGDDADKVMHGQLTASSGHVLMGADVPASMGAPPPNGTVCLSGDDVVLREWFSALAEGGEITVALEKQMWGDEFGELTDAYGVRWMVDLTPPAA